tara:strand:+ start:70064 stop:70471 length:408 start_codon:yes stop_codon:yes gene_type:complete
MGRPPHVVLTQVDYARLVRLLETIGDRDDLAALGEEVDRAEVAASEAVPNTLVTMNSTMRFRDETTLKESELTLVYPGDADVKKNRVSVLAPIGSALIGLSVGDTIDWALPLGRKTTLRVIDVVYQPEAAGHTHL